ncbi:NAD(P)H-hydrate dehydratase [bacterium]|nr:NAD(P)H-hydrate dehydratase [bacterium]
MNVLNAEQMRAADTHAIENLSIPSLTLMENAATRVAEILLRKNPRPRRVLVVCGKGNNGGDGLAVARLLKEAGWSPTVVLLGKVSELKADPAENWSRACSYGVRCKEDPQGAQLEGLIAECDLVIDALFGTGLTKPLEGAYSSAVQKINRAGKEVVSIDLPSGLSSDSGSLIGPAIKANSTIALAALKYSHVLAPACKMCGETYVVDIGIAAQSTTVVVRAKDIRAVLPHRPVDSHKGTFGHAVIVGGSPGKTGAAYMAGKSALRSGAGLVTVACSSQIQPIIASLGPELMTLGADSLSDLVSFLSDKTAVAVGPGMGIAGETIELFQAVVTQFKGPLVIDADGLNLLAEEKTPVLQRKNSSTILTPHPGEMARLMKTDTASVQKDRAAMARRLAAGTGAIVVLKGYRTIVAHPDEKAWIVLTGGQALASAGTGDVLTGIITGFLSQGLKPVEAALAGVYLHGLTSNIFEARYPQQPMNAMDILDWWKEALRLVRSGEDIESEYLKIHFTF